MLAVLLAAAGPAPARPEARSTGVVLFDGDFSSGLSAWPTTIHAERIRIVDDPVLGPTRKVARFVVRDRDTGPTENPRAQIETSSTLSAGGEYWLGWSTLFPRSFRTLPRGGWLTVESVYGAPARDSGPMTMTVSGSELRYQRNATSNFDVPWRMPIVRGRWTDFVWHVKLSRSPSKGFVEIYVNTGSGWRQQALGSGRTRLYMRTLDRSNGRRANSFRLNNYRKRGMFAKVSVYHAAPKVGTSFAAVAPNTYER